MTVKRIDHRRRPNEAELRRIVDSHRARPDSGPDHNTRHRKVRVVGPNSEADIDVEIAPLIKALWERGCDTLGSCQDWDGSAYILFLEGRTGGDFLRSVLKKLRVQCSACLMPLNFGKPSIRFDAMKVQFPQSEIPKISAAIEAVKGRVGVMSTKDIRDDFHSKRRVLQEQLIALQYHQYHIACRCKYSGRTDMHSKVPVVVGHRRAEIDERLAPLIKLIWERGFDTFGCCQEYSQGTSYIDFLAPTQGALWFTRLLTSNNISHETSDNSFEDRFGGTSPDAGSVPNVVVRFPVRKVKFAFDDIRRITDVIRDDPSRRNREGDG